MARPPRIELREANAMTSTHEHQSHKRPRLTIRVLWALHRALYRLSGGRFGLTVPKAGKRFGMMRLHTIGRRSGNPHPVIVGYFTHGPDLVTVAMNGWADADPAWWLNLQANPDTTVDLADGHRAVRARAAVGEERQSLWATARDYPGWGDDIEALAARRSTETAVIVLEPRTQIDSSNNKKGK
jgi:deazaflavin-dependent oxidoreductase (nitroreductase family)